MRANPIEAGKGTDLLYGDDASLPRGKAPSLVTSPPFGSFGTVLGPDDRRRAIGNTKLSPWRMICSLRILTKAGKYGIGTGWLAGPRTIITAGHCVYSTLFMDGWAKSIEVIPGRDGHTQPVGSFICTEFACLPEWENGEKPEFDIGCIHLPVDLDPDVGWFSMAALSDAELKDELVNISGYPGDLSAGAIQYHHRNRIKQVRPRRIFYDIDTYNGQSGSPVWLYRNGQARPAVVGIHAYGIDPALPSFPVNSGPRVTHEVLAAIDAWIK